MDNRQLVGDPIENAVVAFHAKQANIWTALPGIIQSFNPVNKTCVVQPAIMAKYFPLNAPAVNIALPLLLDCPVHFPAGGGCTLTFPLIKGDECLVVFSSRCIDAWYSSGKVSPQSEMRMHDLSDGFVIAGFSSLPNVIPNISLTSTQLRTNDGAAYVGVNSATHEIDVVTPGNIIASAASAMITAPTMTLIGNVQINGTLIVSQQISDQNGAKGTMQHVRDNYDVHTHPGIQPGSGNTGIPSNAL